ncbi:patatin-like phospholipase family protein [Kaistia dalseonensis]|uniref:NTE family protein n=1 Tax=Kaistia dalseonensis TaxID=410840 RepID=A0ABU0H8V7_9HYPH|nr:patatin-like phospholipase family protein [Kaistia dalseonensis]MCX5496113.1 patatin-like phospholipase family protein [Kaistia dalseonensis]MDQ0438720.1 NTE family protein [Kaistia dalseonensis]
MKMPNPFARRQAAVVVAPGQKRINLALQGGGAHGAFTWGVVDELLTDGRLAFEGISGTSAGAMNAAVLADGFVRAGAPGARERLAEFWTGVSRASNSIGSTQDMLQSWMGFWKVPAFKPTQWLDVVSNMTSPYGFNPHNINPLRELIVDLVDFEMVRACDSLKLFISATNVRNGKIKVFTDGEVTADAVMASACLPYLFQTVVIDGEPYWDGGFMGNPALYPFFTETKAEDILLVQINPIERNEIPTGTKEILERMSEITFNASLLREFRAIDFVNRMLDEGRLDPARYRRNRVHRIDAGKALEHFSASTKFDTSLSFFGELHKAGREAARTWLDAHFDDVGVRETVDLRAQFQ